MWPFCSPLYSKHSPQLNLSLLTPSFLAFFWNKHSSSLKPPVFASNHLQITASCSLLLLGISSTSEVCFYIIFWKLLGVSLSPFCTGWSSTLLKEGLSNCNCNSSPTLPSSPWLHPNLYTPPFPRLPKKQSTTLWIQQHLSLSLFLSLKSNRLDGFVSWSCDWKQSNL